MPIELSVKDVREELLRAAEAADAGAGERATLLLGRMFHEVFADLVGRDPERSGARALLDLGPDRQIWHARLLEHAYRALVGPRLARSKAQLQETTEQVLVFWQAVQHLTRWLADLVWTAVEARQGQPVAWEEVAELFSAEVPLACELREPGWTDAVRLTGVADSLLRVPGRAGFCALELKLGRATPAVDLGQVALYHLIVARGARAEGAGAPPRAAGSAIALVRFAPAAEERLVTAEQAAAAQGSLLQLIGRMAGVLPAPPVPPPRARPSTMPPAAPDQREQHAELGRQLARAFREYGRPIDVAGDPVVGPRFLRFEARLGRGVTFEQVARLTTEVRLKVGLAKEPILSKDTGRLTLDVARPDPQTVRFSAVIGDLGPGDPLRGSARLPIGVDVRGALRCADLSNPINAHVLVAGTTGSGKTEWLRMAIAGLLQTNTPETLRLLLLDPKLAAFTELKRSPFLWPRHGLWTPGGHVEAAEVLEDLAAEMDERYQRFSADGVDDLAQHIDKRGRPMPRIVCFCDEYFALISQSREQRRAIEQQIALLGAKARAAGIHLVIATQQPSRQVIQGALDANMPCRVGLMTQSAIESRMLLQTAGAERLTGNGDLLYKDVGDPVRLQAPYLAPDERRRLFGARLDGAP
ncbi:FtsK/SpoIIIE domain-containing protein [Sorangium sp. So ce260]|uniref:FtsK/SpoIIIE domain-containing protein n=1 Tax=Sorangium sp. So ce260 TaxID=3133291 RepID=UPI003F5FED4D